MVLDEDFVNWIVLHNQSRSKTLDRTLFKLLEAIEAIDDLAYCYGLVLALRTNSH